MNADMEPPTGHARYRWVGVTLRGLEYQITSSGKEPAVVSAGCDAVARSQGCRTGPHLLPVAARRRNNGTVSLRFWNGYHKPVRKSRRANT